MNVLILNLVVNFLIFSQPYSEIGCSNMGCGIILNKTVKRDLYVGWFNKLPYSVKTLPIQVVQSDTRLEQKVRDVAQIRNDDYLREIALNNDAYSVRRAAINKIRTLSILKDIAVNNFYYQDIPIILGRIDSRKTLKEISNGNPMLGRMRVLADLKWNLRDPFITSAFGSFELEINSLYAVYVYKYAGRTNILQEVLKLTIVDQKKNIVASTESKGVTPRERDWVPVTLKYYEYGQVRNLVNWAKADTERLFQVFVRKQLMEYEKKYSLEKTNQLAQDYINHGSNSQIKMAMRRYVSSRR